MLKAFLKDNSGTTAIEYGLIAALVSVAILVSLSGLGASITDGYDLVNDAMASAAGIPDAEAPVEIVMDADVLVLEPVINDGGIAIQ